MGHGRERELPSAETVPKPVRGHAFSSGGGLAFRRLVQGETREGGIEEAIGKEGRRRKCLLQKQEQTILFSV